MKLKDFFNIVPIHSYMAVEVRDMDGNRLQTVFSERWVDDDGMPQEFADYGTCEIADIKGDDEITGVVRLVVTSRERLEMRHDSTWDNWRYTSRSGHVYQIAELVRPRVDDGVATYDIGVLMDYDDNTADTLAILDYVFGINDIEQDELLLWCRRTAENYEKNLRKQF